MLHLPDLPRLGALKQKAGEAEANSVAGQTGSQLPRLARRTACARPVDVLLLSQPAAGLFSLAFHDWAQIAP